MVIVALLLLIGFLLILYGFIAVLVKAFSSPKQKENPYITIHKRKVQEDELYMKYLEWCANNGQMEINMENEVRKNEKEFVNDIN